MTKFGPTLKLTGNRQATSSTAAQARSESVIAINPQDPGNMVGASKKFIDPAAYHFRLGPIYTFDAGDTWHESELPLEAGWDGMTDPTVAFDDFGHAFLVGEPLSFGADLVGLGMAVYRSSDGGKTWEQPFRLTFETADDKQWVICDNDPQSPHYGNVYVAWGASSPLRFARSIDHGENWRGKGTELPGSTLVSKSFAPDLSVTPDGNLHILWHDDGTDEIKYLRSTDGGDSFEPLQTAVSGMSSLRGNLPETNGWPHFDHGKFRVVTVVTSCATQSGGVIVAWADMREGRSRIYHRHSDDGGDSWDGPASGQPLLPQVNYGDAHCFHPQIVCAETGTIGCSFYTFDEEQPGKWLIHVRLAPSWDSGDSFSPPLVVTDHPWDPLVDAPKSHGDPAVDFIGEYFGLDAVGDEFALLWTDTRTGVQELFSDVVRSWGGFRVPDLVAEVLFGVIQDGGGVVIIGGKLHRIPPRGPVREAIEALVQVTSEDPAELERAVAEAVRGARGHGG